MVQNRDLEQTQSNNTLLISTWFMINMSLCCTVLAVCKTLHLQLKHITNFRSSLCAWPIRYTQSRVIFEFQTYKPPKNIAIKESRLEKHTSFQGSLNLLLLFFLSLKFWNFLVFSLVGSLTTTKNQNDFDLGISIEYMWTCINNVPEVSEIID